MKTEEKFFVGCTLALIFAVVCGGFYSCADTKARKVEMVKAGATPAEAACALHSYLTGSDSLICDRVFDRR